MDLRSSIRAFALPLTLTLLFGILLKMTRVPDAPFLHLDYFAVIVGSLLALVALLFYGSRMMRDGPGTTPRIPLSTWWLMAFLVIYVVSSAITEPWFFPTHWHSGDALFSRPWGARAVRSIVLTIPFALLLPVLFRGKRMWPAALLTIGIGVYALHQLHRATGFEMIYKVDSPSFVYRFWCLAQTFPRPAFYDPWWNAGLEIPYLVASGTWSLGVFLLPFLKFISPDQLYTPALAFFFLGVIPAITGFSVRWVGGSRRAAWIAALLALAPCQRYWVHLLHYGTAPSLFSMAMTVPLAALLYKLLNRDAGPKAWTYVGILGFGLIMGCWPGSLILALPFVPVMALHARKLFPGKWLWLLACIGVAAVVLLPLAMAPIQLSRLDRFTQTTSHLSMLEHAGRGWRLLGDQLRGVNPIILIFGMAGCVAGPSPVLRRFFVPLIGLMLLLAGWGEEVKALLQTERLIIPASLIAILPAALWMDQIITWSLTGPSKRNLRGALLRVSTAWLMALMVVAGYEAGQTWGARELSPFHTMREPTRELIAWIRTHVPHDGRVMIAGAAVHGFGGAKVAALPMFTGREMMAADFYGFSTKLVDYQYPPSIFRYHGPDRLFAFMEIHNITHILTWHQNWKEVFTRTTQYYEPAHDIGRVGIFAVKRPSTRFIKGTGKVTADFDRFDLQLSGDGQPVAIKYNWVPTLEAEGDARIYPYDAGYGVTMIGIDPGTNRHVTIRRRGPSLF